MLTALLLAAASPQSVVEAERAFAARAQKEGQWSAFRATAAPDAIMFLPTATKVQDWLTDRKDPPASVKWWPTKAWQSCDGMLAVTTGGALWPDGKHGWFTTVWKRQADGGWKWVLDHGDFADTPRAAPAAVAVIKPAGCRKVLLYPVTVMGPPNEGYSRAEFSSADKTLVVHAVGYPGGHSVRAETGGASGNEVVLDDQVRTP